MRLSHVPRCAELPSPTRNVSPGGRGGRRLPRSPDTSTCSATGVGEQSLGRDPAGTLLAPPSESPRDRPSGPPTHKTRVWGPSCSPLSCFPGDTCPGTAPGGGRAALLPGRWRCCRGNRPALPARSERGPAAAPGAGVGSRGCRPETAAQRAMSFPRRDGSRRLGPQTQQADSSQTVSRRETGGFSPPAQSAAWGRGTPDLSGSGSALETGHPW